MKSVNEHIDNLVAGSFAGSLCEEEQRELDGWLSEDEANRVYYDQTLKVWEASRVAASAGRFDSAKAFGRFKHKYLRRQVHIRWASYAFGALALVCLLTLSYRKGNENARNGFEDIVVEAPFGSSARVTLPDGSRVWVNAGSRLCYSQGFGQKDRIVTMNGECYFEVQKNEEMPFYVRTDNLHVKVLGTKFNFRDYPDDGESIVSLKEGRVALKSTTRPYEDEKYLTPNQRAIFDKTTGDIWIKDKDNTNSSNWTDGDLYFDEELLPDIAHDLERMYNVKITLADRSLEKMRVFGNFEARELRIDEVMKLLEKTNSIRYKIEGYNIIIYQN